MTIVMGLDQHRAQITAEWLDTDMAHPMTPTEGLTASAFASARDLSAARVRKPRLARARAQVLEAAKAEVMVRSRRRSQCQGATVRAAVSPRTRRRRRR